MTSPCRWVCCCDKLGAGREKRKRSMITAVHEVHWVQYFPLIVFTFFVAFL